MSIEIKLAEDNLVFKCVSGSRAYNTHTEQSDRDIRSIFIATPEYTLGCLKHIDQVEVPGEDTVIYELAKFIKLCVDNNPNIIELLYTDKVNILFIDPSFEEIRANRHLFLSKKAKFTFSGYAMAQMKRICGHNKWITQEVSAIEKLQKLWKEGKIFKEWLVGLFPEQIVQKIIPVLDYKNNHLNFVASDYLKDQEIRLVSNKPPELMEFAKLVRSTGEISEGEQIEFIQNVFLVKVNTTVFRVYSASNFSKSPISKDDLKNIQYIDIDDEKLSKAKNLEYHGVFVVQQEAFESQLRIWNEYKDWKKNRNEVRSKLEEEHGLDCKHASHLIRLLRMGKEILTTGEVLVNRPDAQELLDIRNGKYDYDILLQMAESMDQELNELYETSTLRASADKEAINKLYMKIVREFWKRKNYENW